MDDAAVFRDVCALQAAGQHFQAHDRAMAALADGATHPGLRHRAVLSLAQAGASGSAGRLFRALRLDAVVAASGDDMSQEVAALGARLLKDQALQGRAGAAALAEDAYARLFQVSGLAWHGVNAAAMALLGRGAEAAAARIAAIGRIADAGDYWGAATIAEAALLGGDEASLMHWLAVAEARAGEDLAMRATTRRQLRWELALLGRDPALVSLLSVPDTLHFCGAIPRGADAAAEAPAAQLRHAVMPAIAGVRAGFGSLAAGADIVIAEALLDAGAALTVVLPFAAREFIATSVAPAGEQWVARFEACCRRARVLQLEAAGHDDLDYVMAGRRAMGLALLQAQRIDGTARQLAVPQATATQSGREAAAWRATGAASQELPCPWQAAPRAPQPPPARLLKAVLFADLPGFGALDDRQLAAFFAGPLPAMAAQAGAAGYRNAWGDAVKLVFDSAAAAAQCGLAMQQALTAEAFTDWGLPGSLIPRIAIDFGPLQPVWDPLQDRAKFAGRVMTRAARIEPVTPPGLVYATEALACEIALTPQSGLACDYAGLVPTAKGFGTLPLYAVRTSP